MQYSQAQIDKANSKDIVEVAESLEIKMVSRGRYKFCLCPDHADNKPSMQVGGRKNVCYCYSCEATYGPISLVMKVKKCCFMDAVKYIIDEEGEQESEKKRRRKKEAKAESAPLPKPTYLYHVDLSSGELSPSPHFHGHIYDFYPNLDNSLSMCLLHRYPREVVEAVTQRYGLALWTDRTFVRATIFPCIDLQGRCHNVKVQEYVTDPKDPRFMHRKPATMWLGSVLQMQGLYDKDRVFDTQALFGEHILSLPGTVALVESPKNAVVGACEWPDLLWVAVGNKTSLTAERLAPLKGRDVLVFPDKDALCDWQARINKLQGLANFRMCTEWMKDVGDKGDIADYVELKIKGA